MTTDDRPLLPTTEALGPRAFWRMAYRDFREEGASDAHAMARADMLRIEYERGRAEARAAVLRELREEVEGLLEWSGRVAHDYTDEHVPLVRRHAVLAAIIRRLGE